MSEVISYGAKCIETWGDGGIQHFKLSYYKGETHVLDGEGNKTIYKHRNNIVYEMIDGKGSVWQKYYNKYNELELITDPLGNVRSLLRDQHGNVFKVILPDGQYTELEYNEVDYPYLPTGWLDVFGLARTRYKHNLTNERVDYLRDRTPSDDRRREVNDGVTLPMDDFALPGLKITSILQADHIVPFAKIISLPGFDKLTLEQQLEIVNFKDNFIGLSETANKSKNSQTYAEWDKYKKGNIDVDAGFKKTMMEREIKLESQIQNKINEFNANNK